MAMDAIELNPVLAAEKVAVRFPASPAADALAHNLNVKPYWDQELAG